MARILQNGNSLPYFPSRKGFKRVYVSQHGPLSSMREGKLMVLKPTSAAMFFLQLLARLEFVEQLIHS